MQLDPDRVDSEVDIADEALGFDYLTDGEECIIIDSKVPYHHNLKRNLIIKSNILINGFVPPNADKFSVDLCSHKFDKFRMKRKKEIVFHFNPRFSQNCVVRNSFISGAWGTEEVHALKRNPFKRGQMFIMEIYVLKNEYLVSVNGVHFCSFPHRVSPLNVDSIDMWGDIQLLKVELSVREMYPSTESTLLLEDDAHNKLGTPLAYRLLPSGLRFGSQIEINGRVKLLPFGFHVRLQSGPEVYPQPAVPYQLSAKWQPERFKVSVNYWIREDGGWEPEIICSNVFKPNGHFSIIVTIARFGYITDVANQKFPLLKHSLDIETINTLFIQGDVVIHDIKTLY